MNLNTMPCGATAALDDEMRRIDSAEKRQARLEAEYPLDDFEEAAWEHAFDETGFCLLTDLATDIPYTVLQVLLIGAEVNHPNKLPEIAAEYAKRSVSMYVWNWIEREKERLQEKAMENAA